VQQDLASLLQKSGCNSLSDAKFAEFLDLNDPLREVRAEFFIPKEADIKATAVDPNAVDKTPIPGMLIGITLFYCFMRTLAWYSGILTSDRTLSDF
jgi:hypothetical protein